MFLFIFVTNVTNILRDYISIFYICQVLVFTDVLIRLLFLPHNPVFQGVQTCFSYSFPHPAG